MTDVQLRPVGTDGDEATIAGHPSERFRGNVGAVIKRASQRAIRPEHILIQVNHHLEAFAAGSGHGMAG